jgi:regulator of RNase E activity RraA
MTPARIARRFARIYTAAITDVMDEMGHLHQTLPPTIRPLDPRMRCAGLAFPARGRARPMSAAEARRPRARDRVLRKFLAMLGAAPRDSVLVLRADDRAAAHFGELSATWFRVHGVRGAVVDGATRDAAAIVRMGFPVFARYLTPQDSVPRWEAVEWGRPVTIGSGRHRVRVAPGDVVVADLDGVVVVPRRIASEVLRRCERLVGTEGKVRRAVRRGVPPLSAYERYGAF